MSDVTIRVRENGPLVVTGPVQILDADGNRLPCPQAAAKGNIALCRCGHSRSKPFCDGSHRTPPSGAE